MPDAPALKVISRGRPFAALLDGEAEALVRKSVELAKAGDLVMLKFVLGRILPRAAVARAGLVQAREHH